MTHHVECVALLIKIRPASRPTGWRPDRRERDG